MSDRRSAGEIRLEQQEIRRHRQIQEQEWRRRKLRDEQLDREYLFERMRAETPIMRSTPSIGRQLAWTPIILVAGASVVALVTVVVAAAGGLCCMCLYGVIKWIGYKTEKQRTKTEEVRSKAASGYGIESISRESQRSKLARDDDNVVEAEWEVSRPTEEPLTKPKPKLKRLPAKTCEPVVIIQPASRSKAAAILLALFLGTFGAHRFYLGGVLNIILGIFYILLFSTGLPTAISVIEAIVFLFTPRRRWEAKYGK